MSVSTDDLSRFCRSFCSKESFWKDATYIAKSGFELAVGMLESGLQDILFLCGCIATRRLELFLTYSWTVPAPPPPPPRLPPSAPSLNYLTAGSLHRCHTAAQQLSASNSHWRHHNSVSAPSEKNKCWYWYCLELFAWAMIDWWDGHTRYEMATHVITIMSWLHTVWLRWWPHTVWLRWWPHTVWLRWWPHTVWDGHTRNH